MTTTPQKLVPPFNREIAIAKVRMAEDAWNSRDCDRVSLAYTEDSFWRNRAEIFQGREASTNDYPILECDRRFHWLTSAPRPQDHPGLFYYPE